MAKASSLIDTRIVYCGDCLDQLKRLPDKCVDLCYIDPPFNSNRTYEVFWGETKEKRAFEDRHESTRAYLDYMRPRVVEIARVLKQSGSFYFHCDWHASHYIKVMLDQIFGENSFQNELIWKRTTAHADTKGFGHVHDTIFRYSNGRRPTFHPPLKAYTQEYIDRYFIYEDEYVAARGKHWRDNITGAGLRGGETGQPWRGIDPATLGRGRHWIRRPSELDQMLEEGRIYISPRGTPRLERYAAELKGVPIDSMWDDIPALGSFSGNGKEALGYPTQKPLSLLDRIIEASSNENDVVLDAFCGCGTALVSAQRLKRQWIGIDISPTACRVMAKRLRDVNRLPENETLWRSGRGFVVRDLPQTEMQLRRMPPFEFENWAVIALGGITNKTQVGDMGVDGRIYPASVTPVATPGTLDFMDDWYPVQVKQKDKAGRPDIDAFEAAMLRSDRRKGFFVSFDYTSDARSEIDRFFRQTGRVIVLLTVREILDEEIAMRLA